MLELNRAFRGREPYDTWMLSEVNSAGGGRPRALGQPPPLPSDHAEACSLVWCDASQPSA